MRVAVIGAGVSGLASARYVQEFNLECVVFEARDSVGGTWIYTEEVPTDEYNVAFHANIYESLRVNLPTQLMEYSGFKFEPKSGLNYPYHREVLQYIKDFAEKFNLYPLIKFQHLVQHISRDGDGWKIIVKNLKNNRIDEEYFDAVMICNGHHAKPVCPCIPGLETFDGDQKHSHYYKNNAPYKEKRILVVGCGPSGIDICLECAQVYISCRSEKKPAISHDKVEIKPGIVRISSNSVMFVDKTVVEVDSIIFCTGFEFHFPFLDKSCGIEISKNLIVRPLYKRFINILHPTMCFIGLVIKTVVFPLVDLQAKVFMKHLSGQIDLPLIGSMLQSEEEEHGEKMEMNVPPSMYHFLGENMKSYFKDLASLGQTEMLSEVHFKIYEKHKQTIAMNSGNTKKQIFKIIDDENFSWQLK
ncbi:hypothetical protein V9T40_005056 [Parthenolecanium corni]|uniref:Flavin-containing monooxygenase n=1 Tax=Parthenolecanium corni TaxID=536013 RepID=A0AAN9THG4_9HEMI